MSILPSIHKSVTDRQTDSQTDKQSENLKGQLRQIPKESTGKSLTNEGCLVSAILGTQWVSSWYYGFQKSTPKIERKVPPPGGHFHDDWAKNVTSRVHVIQLTGTIFQLNSRIKETNVLTKFHENWAKNVTFRKNAPAISFSPIGTIFELVRDINKTNVLSNFHDWAKIVTSRVFTRKTNRLVFQQTRTTFELNQHIIKTNILTNFKLRRYIIGTHLLTKFHEDRTKNVASRVFTMKTAPPTGGHFFQQTRTTFELNQHIIKTNI
ncbi:hypothetical protein DPMN_019678 [Dreissena polymorpha]|uniref:Uncharacterized protein n=1 Tax=Dreissena polymorpha TaxID=45954 RepID=A0A9D4S9I2_DREPO|nr:hypothetical protein DPMN_019678 [Dreissena polymorpha]